MSRTGKNTSRSSPNGLDFSEDPWKQVIKRRRRFTIEETKILEEEYGKNPSPNQDKIQQIANIISTPRKIVTTWFQNRRAKNKRRERDSRREALRIRIRRTSTNTLSRQGSSRDDEDYDGDVDDIVYGNTNYNLEPEDEEYYAGSSRSNNSGLYTTTNHMNSNSQEITSIDNSFDLNLDATAAHTLVTQSPNNICQNHDDSLVSPPSPNTCQHPHTFVSQSPSNNNNQFYNTHFPQTTNQQLNINFIHNTNNFFQSSGMNQHQQPFSFFHHPQQQYQPEYPYNFNNNDNIMNRAAMPYFVMNNNYNNFSSPVNNNDNSNAGLCINPLELFFNFSSQELQQQQPRGQITQHGGEGQQEEEQGK